MEFWLVALIVVVIWIVNRQIRLSDELKKLEALQELVERQERRLAALEGAAKSATPTAPQTEAQPEPQPVPKPVEEFLRPVRRAVPPDLARYRTPPPVAATPPVEPTPAPQVEAVAQQTSEAFEDQPVTAPFLAAEAQPAPEPVLPTHSPSLEERLGENWLSKLGIVILVIGLSLFFGRQLRTLGPLGKAVVGAVISLGILAGGLVLERRSKYRLFARAGIGGGWALTFFLSYALYHLPATQVIQSQLVDLVLMMLVAVGMVWHSLRYKSQVVTSLAFLLAFVTVGISHVTLFSLVAGALLAAGLVYVAARESWYELGLAGLIGVYLNHYLWLDRVLPNGGQPGHPFPEFAASAGLLLLYWLIFRLAYVLREPPTRRQEALAAVTAILNSAGLMGLLKYQSTHPEWAFYGLLALGTAEMLLALFAWRRRRQAFVVLSSIASLLLLAAIPFRFNGSSWSLFWLFEAEMLFLAGLRLREVVFRRLGLLAGFAAAIQLLAVDLFPIVDLRQSHPDTTHHLASAIALLTAAVLFWANAHLAPLRWAEPLAEEFDAACLTATSYVGLVTAAAGLWVLFPGGWTAVAWLVALLPLGLAADRLRSRDLATQTDLLGLAALLRIGLINLQLDDLHVGSISLRTLTLTLAAALCYAAMRRGTPSWLLPTGYIAPAYSWAGSALLGLLVWYELQPIHIALGWGVLGLVLFEIGLLLKRSHLRRQGYALLAMGFVRIFFFDLYQGASTHLASPRVHTILPLVALWLWVYERQRRAAETSDLDRAATYVAVCYATSALAALTYFEFNPDWVCVAWAAMVFVLLLAAWTLRRQVFLAQALVLLLAAGARAILFNLLASPTPTATFWSPRTNILAITCALLLAALPLAFRLRRKTDDGSPLTLILARPEQPLFFTPLLLTTLFLAIQMRAGMITVAWSALGVLVFLFALLVKERSYRLAGLGLLLLGVGKIVCVDIWNASPADRYLTLIVMGASLLLISFLYTRYREAIHKLL